MNKKELETHAAHIERVATAAGRVAVALYNKTAIETRKGSVRLIVADCDTAAGGHCMLSVKLPENDSPLEEFGLLDDVARAYYGAVTRGSKDQHVMNACELLQAAVRERNAKVQP